ncbi:MAG: PQQ-binding-like beta-propeller repeat protein [Jatrophihabitans sp.]
MRLRHLVIVGATVVLSACAVGTDNNTTYSKNISPGLSGVGDLPAPASAWPAAGYDARHSSATKVVGPQTARVKWQVDLGGDLTPGPVIGVDGSVLAASNSGTLYALDPADGKQRWKYDGGGSYGDDLSTSPAVLADGTILWPGPGNTLYALSKSGSLLWKERFAGLVLSPAVAGGNRVYVADRAGHLAALTVAGATHRRVWEVSFGGTDYGSPTVGTDGTVFTASDKDLVAIRDLGGQGAVLWRFHAKKMVEVSSAVGPDGTVLLGTNHDKQFGISAGGTILWSLDIGDYTYSSSVVRPDGTGYFGDNMGRLRIINNANGKVVQTITPLGKPNQEKIWTAPVVDARSDVYWATTRGNVYGYSRSGAPLFRFRADAGVNSYPALGGDGTLYFGSTSGTFYALR